MAKWRSTPIFVILRHSNPEDSTIVTARRNKRWAEKEVERLREATGDFYSIVKTDLLEEHHL